MILYVTAAAFTVVYGIYTCTDGVSCLRMFRIHPNSRLR